MLRNPLYVYGPKDVLVPAKLNFGEFFLDKIWQHRDRVAFIRELTTDTVTYREIAQEAMNLSVSLINMGLRKGQAIAICSENRREFWSVVLGGACSGGVVTTINPGYGRDEIKHVMNISKPVYIFISQTAYKTHKKVLKTLDYLKKIIIIGDERHQNSINYNDIARPESKSYIRSDSNITYLKENVKYKDFEVVDVNGQTDTLFILYSSGTTGLPKGVMMTHLNVIATCCLSSYQDPNQMTLTITPWYHTLGMVGNLADLTKGRSSVYMPKFDLDVYLKCIEKYKIIQLTVVPPVLVAACKSQAKYDLSSVKLIYSGAAPLYKETSDAAKERFPNLENVLQGYGMTEVTLAITRFSYDDLTIAKPTIAKPGSVGTVVANTVIKVVDLRTRKALGPNQPGEICVRGITVMRGYVGRDRSEDFDDEGFYKTGDIGYYDNDGCFFIVDRLKELIKYKGHQVPPAEIEGILLQHDAVRDAAVIGIKHSTAGEVPLAFIATKPGRAVTGKEIKDFIAERMSNPKHLRGGVRFIDQIPKNPSGKTLRRALKLMVKDGNSKL